MIMNDYSNDKFEEECAQHYQAEAEQAHWEQEEMQKEINASRFIKAMIIERHKEYRELLDKGKGEWPKAGYVKDERWAQWIGIASELENIIQKWNSISTFIDYENIDSGKEGDG